MEKTVKKHKFNAIDAILIILILAIIGAAVFFFVFSGADDKVNDSGDLYIEYEVEFRTVRNEFREILKERSKAGDRVLDSHTGQQLGEIVEIRYENAKYSGNDMSAEGSGLVSFDYPNHSNITMVIKSKAAIGEYGRYTLDDDFDLSVGTPVSVRLPYFTQPGYCTRLQEITETEAE